jgi:acid phosphatase type 7
MRLLLVLISSAFAGYLYPEQIHLSWTEREAEMRATWVTYYQVGSQIAYRPTVCNNIVQKDDWSYVTGTSKSFDEGTVIPRIQYIHTGIMTGLKSECLYEYSVGTDLYWSDIYNFTGRTPDYEAPFDTSQVNLVLLGDWGTGPNGVYTNSLLGEEAKVRDFQGILHNGDIAYDLHDSDGRTGDTWLNMVQSIASSYAYMTLPGNHEDFDNSTHYKNRFNMPINEANDGTGYFFSFDIGPAHFILFDTELYVLGQTVSIQTQLNWLVADLAKANTNRQVRPWVIALSHHPIYCSADFAKLAPSDNIDCYVNTKMLQKELEDVLYENGVDLVFGAHTHNYERDTPIYKNVTVPSEFDGEHIHIGPKAPIYITNGNAGNVEGYNPYSSTPQDWARYLSDAFGYGRLTVYNNTHLYYEQFSAQSLEEIDYLWVVKTQNRYNTDLLVK